MTWTSAFGRGCGVILQAIVNGLALTRISPNVLTFIGLLINTVAAVFFGLANSHNYVHYFLYAGLVIIGAGIFDMVDGRVARQTDQVTVFGAFFDSVIDRYSDVVLFFGLLVFYARGNRFFYVVLAGFVMVTSLMVSYTRARSEALIGSCKVGFMERPERVVLIILGALFERWGAMAPALWVLAVLSTITVIHRISYTYTMAKKLALDQPATQTEPVPIRSAASPGPVSSTASVTGAEQHDLLSVPTAPRA
ncbi:MAG TPA: CDP-alcohol phosphatidyltransferase family protein [Acidobacteriaceae bacterium]|jgi:CDP-diacylglycerol--glycerol-3-phosphate 3-phosphatidyltransferase|nr:CDP-alcohol phosphatidyltransferase family protein [Acidobacteriaceae bacterium]